MAVSEKLGRKNPIVDDVLSSQEQGKQPSIPLDESCIEFEFQTDRNFYVDLRQTYLALKLKFFKGFGYETYNTKEVKKENKEEAQADEEMAEEEQRVQVTPVTHVKNIFRLNFDFFPMSRCTSTISKITIQMDSMRTSVTFPTISRQLSLNTWGVSHCKYYHYEEFPDEILEAPLSEAFFEKRKKSLVGSMALSCIISKGLISSPPPICCIQLWKLGYV